MSGTHDKLYHGNKFHHWKFSDLVLDLNYFSFSHHNPYPNPTYLPKHEFLNPNNQFHQRIWYAEYYSVHAYMVWSQKFRKSEISLDTGVQVSGEISDFEPCAHVQSNILHIKYAEKIGKGLEFGVQVSVSV